MTADDAHADLVLLKALAAGGRNRTALNCNGGIIPPILNKIKGNFDWELNATTITIDRNIHSFVGGEFQPRISPIQQKLIHNRLDGTIPKIALATMRAHA